MLQPLQHDTQHQLWAYSGGLLPEPCEEGVTQMLLDLAKCRGVEAVQECMFSGEISFTKDRTVLHMALWNWLTHPFLVNGKEMMPGVKRALEKVKSYCQQSEVVTWSTRASSSWMSLS